MSGGKLLGRLLTSSALWRVGGVMAPDGVGNSAGRTFRSVQLAALEPRVLFDAAMADTMEHAGDVVHDPVAAEAAADDGLIAALVGLPADEPAMSAPVSIAFVDTQVAGFDGIISAMGPEVEVHLISAGQDGVAQMAGVLAGRSDISAVHIISHGTAGSLALGSTALTAASMQGEHAGHLATIAAALSGDADILIYGCDFGAGAAGQEAVQLLASATGADVAASSDITGAAELGGDWTLEVQQGEITTASLAAWNWFSTLASQVINAGGGNAADGSDGLQIHVIDNGQLQIGYQLTSAQNAGLYSLYEPTTTAESSVLFNGVSLAIGNQVTGSNNGSDGTFEALWGEGGQTLTGTGSPSDPYIVTTTLYSNTDGNASYNPATDVQVVIRTIYVVPNGYFTQEVTVTPPPTNTEVLKYYHAMDTFLSGGDNGPAFSLPQNLAQTNNTTGDPSLVAVRKVLGPGLESFVGFAEVQGGRQFDHWYSAFYAGENLYGYSIAGGIDGGSDIVNTWDTNASTDNAVAVQFTLGAINMPTTWSYLVAFTSEASIDLDADNSSGATGAAYNTTYTAGSGATIPVADVDAHISNVTGDIQQVRITLNNQQAGDTLTVNAGALPAGVTILSQTATQIVLSAVGTPQTEATFDAAIQTIGFTTTSGSISARTIDFAVTNEIGVEGFASATTIGINQPPNAQNDAFTVNEDATLTGNLFANNGSGADSDPESDPFAITAINGASFTVGVPIALANGSLTITDASTGAFTFQPNGNYAGPASFTYTVTDPEGGTDTASASITVANVNDAPQGSNATLTATEDTPRPFSAADFGFSDPNDSPANSLSAVIITTLPATGTLLLSGNPVNPGDTITAAQIPNLTWTPPLNVNGGGQGTFTFQVVDNGGTANGGQNTDQSPNSINFTVTAVNDPPVLDLDGNNSSGATGASYEATYIENAPGINIVDSADFVFTDVDNGVVEIVVTLTDGQIGDTLNFPSLLPGGITASVLPVATLVAPGTMTVTFTGTPATTLANWQAVMTAVTFLPSTNDVNNPNPADRHITIQASDESGDLSNLATATIHITPQNDAPTLDMDDDNSTGNAGNVYLSYTENGAAVSLHSGALSTDLDDTNYESATITFTNPQAGDQLFVGGVLVSAGSSGSIAGIPYTVTSSAGQLVVSFTGTGTIASYDAVLESVSFSSTSDNPSTVQRDITFQINDGTDNSPLRHAFVNFTAVNDPPSGSPIPQQSGQDSVALAALNTSAYFTDPDGPALTYSLAPGAPPWLSINSSTGVITGTPPLHASTTTNGTTPGTWDVTVVASDGSLSDSETFTYVITNPPPVAQPDLLNVTEGAALTGANVFAANGNGADIDPDGDTFSVSQVGGSALNVGNATAGSAGGLFTISSNGALNFSDNGDFEDLGVGETRNTTITYQITDTDGGTSSATVKVMVTGSNDAPVVTTPFTDPASVTDGNTGFTFNGASAFTDVDGDTLTYSLGAGAPSWLTINGSTGVVSVVGSIPADASQNTNIVAGADGTYDVLVIATDPTGGTVNDTLRLTVTNLAPVAQDDAASVGEDAADVTGNVMTGSGADADTAPDSDTLTVVSAMQGIDPITIGAPFTTAGGGVLTLFSGGGYTFVPGTAYNGLDVGETAVETISYTVDDGNGGQDTAVLVITVNGANDAPVPVDPGDPGPDPENPIPADPATIVPVQTADDGEAFTAGSPLVDLAPYIVDPDADPVTFSTASTLPAGLTLNSNGTVTGTIANTASQGGDVGNPGVYTILIDVTDGTATVQLTLTIDVSNLAPVAQADTASVGEDAVNVTGNVITGPGTDADTAPDSDPLSVIAAEQGGNPIAIGTPFTTAGGGVLTLLSGGGYTFVPGTAYNGLDVGETATETITYTVSDGNGGTDTATLTITIQGANDGPVVIDPSNPGTPPQSHACFT
jgi:VCBS repeat-containing protein